MCVGSSQRTYGETSESCCVIGTAVSICGRGGIRDPRRSTAHVTGPCWAWLGLNRMYGRVAKSGRSTAPSTPSGTCGRRKAAAQIVPV